MSCNQVCIWRVARNYLRFIIMILGLVILYLGLTFLDFYYDFDWLDFSSGMVLLSLLIGILCLIDGLIVTSMIWFVVFLIEKLSYNKTHN